MQLKRYQKDFDYSYSFGIYPTMELLKNRAEYVEKILLKEGAERFGGVKDILDLCSRRKIPFEYRDKVIDKIAFKENTFVVGMFRKYESPIDGSRNHIVLLEPRNMGNVGTIVRSMLGFGFKDLCIIGPGVDIFAPKVISSTMGSLFFINFSKFNSINEYSVTNSNRNLYIFTSEGSEDISNVEFKEPFSFVFGNESKGIENIDLSIGKSIYIPQSKELESLNLSVAASIAMWESFKKR